MIVQNDMNLRLPQRSMAGTVSANSLRFSFVSFPAALIQ
jgi:hypothetical protein